MRAIRQRLLELSLPARRSAFLWGPRKVGKTYWLQHSLQREFRHIDLLRTEPTEFPSRLGLVVCTETGPSRLADGVEVLPWQLFPERLWGRDLPVSA